MNLLNSFYVFHWDGERGPQTLNVTGAATPYVRQELST